MRKLKKLKKSLYPKRVIYFDTETASQEVEHGEIHTFRLGVSRSVGYNKDLSVKAEEEITWNSGYDLCRYLETQAYQHNEIYVIAHNIHFDLQVSGFYRWFREWGWRVKFIYDNGLTYILKIVMEKTTITLLSSTNYYQTSLKALGDLIGLPKLDVDFSTSSNEELVRYCSRDVEIVQRAMEYYYQFLQVNSLGGFALSLSGQSLRAFRSQFLKHDIYLHDNDRVDELERQSYYGGRCEAFHLGKMEGDGFITLDVNSMYPHVMLAYKYPTKLLTHYEDNNLKHLKSCLTKYCVIAHVLVKTKTPRYPKRHKKRLTFPVGAFDTYLTTNSLIDAFERKEILYVFEYTVYWAEKIFDKYVTSLYALRKNYREENNLIMSKLCKLLLNSLYGKWAQRIGVQTFTYNQQTKNYYREQILDLNRNRYVINYELLNTRIRETDQIKAPTSFFAIAAHVTDNARRILMSGFDAVGWENVLYCDTDSMKIETATYPKIASQTSETALGSWKNEGETNNLEIMGCKMYLDDTQRKLKGVPKNATDLGDNYFQYLSFVGQATHLRKGLEEGFFVQKVTKKLSGKYEKGNVANDGKVTPYLFFCIPSLFGQGALWFFAFEASWDLHGL